MLLDKEKLEASASPTQCRDALRDVGALHTRVVPGF
jgi:hypothetical protein